MNPDFWKGKKVFLTGHTGFKGSWLALWLQQLGSELTGYSLEPMTDPSLFTVADIKDGMSSIIGDIRDNKNLENKLLSSQPDIVIHMAAQSLVRYSYDNPVETYEVNIMGTIYLLEAVRKSTSCKAVLIITSDKCYENDSRSDGYDEGDPMGGYDPYSSSKGCTELVVSAYRRSFFDSGKQIATGRAGNVIGGGDWSEDRLIPDLIRAFSQGRRADIRMPEAVRPWQHVMDVISGYLVLIEKMFEFPDKYAGPWNFGPPPSDIKTVEWIANKCVELWIDDVKWHASNLEHLHEASYLSLDSSKARRLLGWETKLDLSQAMEWTINWYRDFYNNKDIKKLSNNQINQYIKLMHS